ncbi:MAG: hypothetical protein KKC99_10440, partial [Proteobacteria bacterium]|nr:hypothetical protein [Pseudomonadota bacterium]
GPTASAVVADLIDIGTMGEEEREFARQLCNVQYLPRAGYQEMVQSNGFACTSIVDVTDEVMLPLDSKFREAVQGSRDQLVAFSSPEVVEGFAGVCSALARTAGYILVTATRV